MRGLLAHGAAALDVVPHDRAVDAEVHCGPEGEVRDDELGGLTTLLVHEDDVAELCVPCLLDDLGHAGTSSVHSLRVRDDQTHLLCKRSQLLARCVRRRDQHLGVLHACSCILVVDVCFQDPCFLIVKFQTAFVLPCKGAEMLRDGLFAIQSLW